MARFQGAIAFLVQASHHGHTKCSDKVVNDDWARST